jgi:hypothetical protein
MKCDIDAVNAAAAAYATKVDATFGSPLRAGGFCYILAGQRVADPATAYNPANLLVAVELPNPAFSPPVNGAVAWPSTLPGLVLRDGVATWFRMANRDGVGVWDGSIVVWDGSGPQPVGDMITDNATLLKDGTISISYSLQVPVGN